MKQDIINFDGKTVGSLELNPAVFGQPERKDILHRVVVWQQARARSGNAQAQVRSEVSRTTKKLYKQKHTGNARHGSRRSNIFVGGAAQFGPRARDWSFNLNKKIRQLGLRTALSVKAANQDLIIVDEAKLDTHKTKDFAQKLQNLNLTSVTFIVDAYDDNFDRASRNIPHLKVIPTEGANVYDILRQEKLVLTKAAVALLTGRLLGETQMDAVADITADAPAAKKASPKAASKSSGQEAQTAPAKKASAKKTATQKAAAQTADNEGVDA